MRQGDPRLPAEKIARGARVPRPLPSKLSSLRCIERFPTRVSVSGRFSQVWKFAKSAISLYFQTARPYIARPSCTSARADGGCVVL